MRSWLYIPDIRNVGNGDADALVVDVERAGDAAAVRSWIEAAGHPSVWARLPLAPNGNGDEERQRAVRTVVSPALAGICVAAASANELAALGTVIAEAEEAVGLPVGRIAVVPRLETAAAVLQAAEIARAPRVV